MKNVTILGAGASGLATAHFAQKQGWSVQIFEAAKEPGGRMQTTQEQGYLVEHGPIGWLENEPALDEVCMDLGLETISSVASDTHRYLQQNGELRPLPQNPEAFLKTPLLSWKEKLRFLSEPWADLPEGSQEESIFDFSFRRFGAGFTEKIISPIVSGLFAGDVKKLSLSAMFPAIQKAEEKHGSLMKTYRKWAEQGSAKIQTVSGGLGQLAKTMADSHGEAFHAECIVDTALFEEGWWYLFCQGKQLARTKNLVIALPPKQAAVLLREYLGTQRSVLADLAGNDLISATLAYSRNGVQDSCAGFGYFTDPTRESPLLSVQFIHSIFPHAAPKDTFLFRCLLGGASHPNLAETPPQDLLAWAQDEISLALGANEKPLRTWIHASPGGVPQYDLGYNKSVTAIQKKLAHYPGLFLAGDALFGVGINAAFRRGAELAQELSRPRNEVK